MTFYRDTQTDRHVSVKVVTTGVVYHFLTGKYPLLSLISDPLLTSLRDFYPTSMQRCSMSQSNTPKW